MATAYRTSHFQAATELNDPPRAEHLRIYGGNNFDTSFYDNTGEIKFTRPNRTYSPSYPPNIFGMNYVGGGHWFNQNTGIQFMVDPNGVEFSEAFTGHFGGHPDGFLAGDQIGNAIAGFGATLPLNGLYQVPATTFAQNTPQFGDVAVNTPIVGGGAAGQFFGGFDPHWVHEPEVVYVNVDRVESFDLKIVGDRVALGVEYKQDITRTVTRSSVDLGITGAETIPIYVYGRGTGGGATWINRTLVSQIQANFIGTKESQKWDYVGGLPIRRGIVNRNGNIQTTKFVIGLSFQATPTPAENFTGAFTLDFLHQIAQGHWKAKEFYDIERIRNYKVVGNPFENNLPSLPGWTLPNVPATDADFAPLTIANLPFLPNGSPLLNLVPNQGPSKVVGPNERIRETTFDKEIMPEVEYKADPDIVSLVGRRGYIYWVEASDRIHRWHCTINSFTVFNSNGWLNVASQPKQPFQETLLRDPLLLFSNYYPPIRDYPGSNRNHVYPLFLDGMNVTIDRYEVVPWDSRLGIVGRRGFLTADGLNDISTRTNNTHVQEFQGQVKVYIFKLNPDKAGTTSYVETWAIANDGTITQEPPFEVTYFPTDPNDQGVSNQLYSPGA